MCVSNRPIAEYNWKKGSAKTAGGAIRFVSNQKNRCLSLRNRYLEKAYAAGKATSNEMKVLIVT